jgi:hypothetical protein
MRLILSRKGFDSSAGGVPSPIFPDGRMVSLPIPDRQSHIRYDAIKFEGENIAPLVSSLTRGRIEPDHGAHLDPDLSSGSLPRLDGWRAIFGQTGTAQSHLCKHGVQPGDLFLFFGLFRRIILENGEWAWSKGSRPVHAIWGWLQIGEILPVDTGKGHLYDWAVYHPHCYRGPDKNNFLYFSSSALSLGGIAIEGISGAGVFPRFSATRQLTARSAPNPSLWELPEWFFPQNGLKPLTYHADMGRWRRTEHWVELRAAARGQEFILDCDEYPEAFSWLSSLIKTGFPGS